MLQYIPRSIAPEVLDTLLIIHHISARKPKKILDHVLSCTKIEDTAQAYKLYACGTLNLNCRDAEEAISQYTRDFVKVNRKTPTPQSNTQALTRKFLNGIRPEPLKRLLKSEAEDFLISSIPEILKRLTVLLPEYHRSLHYQLFEDRLANKYSGNPNRRINNQTVLQSFEFDIVHIEEKPRKERKKERKTRNSTARTKNTIEKCCCYLAHLTSLTQTLTDSWNKIDLDSIAIEPSAPLTSKFQPGDRVFVLRDKPAKLHGHFVGPYVVEEQLTNSSILVKNTITRNLLKTSIHLVKPCTSSLPKEILDSYVAADKGEHVIDAIDSIDNNDAAIMSIQSLYTQSRILLPTNDFCCSTKMFLRRRPVEKKEEVVLALSHCSCSDDVSLL
ncbi:hypothetical protein P9112_010085 [Eukaryota sp. TZLM1-RC]